MGSATLDSRESRLALETGMDDFVSKADMMINTMRNMCLVQKIPVPPLLDTDMSSIRSRSDKKHHLDNLMSLMEEMNAAINRSLPGGKVTPPHVPTPSGGQGSHPSPDTSVTANGDESRSLAPTG